MSGIIVKYFPECYHFDKTELNHILSAELATRECSQVIESIEKTSYISRNILVSEFDGQTYHPKYHKKLVHIEITLQTNTPKEYADWAIHDNENDKGQRNFHIHVKFTLRPLTENGEWGTKTKRPLRTVFKS